MPDFTTIANASAREKPAIRAGIRLDDLADGRMARAVAEDMAALARAAARVSGFADLADFTAAGYVDAVAIAAGVKILVTTGTARRAEAPRPARRRAV